MYRGKALALLIASIVANVALAGGGQNVPVLMVYGFQPIPGFRTTQLWELFAETLSGSNVTSAQEVAVASDHDFYFLPAADPEHRDVFLSNYALSYEPTTRDLFFYARRLADEIEMMKSEFGVFEFDIIAHSMGGLLARMIVEREDFDGFPKEEGLREPGFSYDGGVRTLVLLATPNFGIRFASLGEWFSTLSRQLEPDSDFLARLNDVRWQGDRLSALNPQVRYVSLAGQTCLGCGLRLDEEACLEECVDQALAWGGSDLVVMMHSAYLPEAENCALIGFDHIRNHTDPEILPLLERILSGERSPAAFYTPELQPYQPEPAAGPASE